jgi:DDE superfamily endonuclease
MEKILDIYAAEYDTAHPLICMDEAAKQITADLEPALPLAPGQPRREDHHYQRIGVRAIFLFFDPIRGWRRVVSRESRKRVDWAQEVKRLINEDYPHAERVTLVCDNLNTHDIASLYTAFDAPTAHHLAKKLNLVHTPRNGSWLNMAEMELSILSRQCINRRFESASQMDQHIEAWQIDRNKKKLGANWRFTTPDARIKLKSLYPVPAN